jgi:hypothetical protein
MINSALSAESDGADNDGMFAYDQEEGTGDEVYDENQTEMIDDEERDAVNEIECRGYETKAEVNGEVASQNVEERGRISINMPHNSVNSMSNQSPSDYYQVKPTRDSFKKFLFDTASKTYLTETPGDQTFP